MTFTYMGLRERHIVIMAGGIGSRFWPVSTPECPKQFLDILGVGRTLLQLTVDRFLSLAPIDHIWIVTSIQYVSLVQKQLPNLPADHILAEPQARNTAPCIGYACWKIYLHHPDANIVVTPSDAIVLNTSEFHRILGQALDYTENHDAIVTIGIRPSRPETGYGYICVKPDAGTIAKVQAFKEKPDSQTARTYLQAGNYFWNAGIFVWNIQTIMNAFRTFTPQLAAIMDRMAVDFYSAKESTTVAALFPGCERISIDYAIMEKSNEIYMIPAAFGWSDLGSWGALQELTPHMENGNAVIGNQVKLVNCKNCMVHVGDQHKVFLEGLDGYIVAEHNGRFLVCRLSEEQKIKEFTTAEQ